MFIHPDRDYSGVSSRLWGLANYAIASTWLDNGGQEVCHEGSDSPAGFGD